MHQATIQVAERISTRRRTMEEEETFYHNLVSSGRRLPSYLQVWAMFDTLRSVLVNIECQLYIYCILYKIIWMYYTWMLNISQDIQVKHFMVCFIRACVGSRWWLSEKPVRALQSWTRWSLGIGESVVSMDTCGWRGWHFRPCSWKWKREGEHRH